VLEHKKITEFSPKLLNCQIEILDLISHNCQTWVLKVIVVLWFMSKMNTLNLSFGVVSIIVVIFAFVNETYRYLIVSLFLFLVIIFYVSSYRKEVDKQAFEVRRLNEKIKIHEDLINLKVRLRILEEKNG